MTMRAICAAVLTAAVTLAAFEAQARAKPQKDALQLGAEDFRTYCASCHGMNARGQGPVAPFLVRKPPDLTLLAAAHDGEFPTDLVYFIIDGRGEVLAHGTREMPVWGEQFGGDEREKRERILNIIAYLKTLQRPANPVPR